MKQKKKFLGVVGSPRKNGNTHILVEKIIEGAQCAGAAADIILLGELNIQECDGCHLCWKGRGCSKKDDMNDIYPKIIEADVLVLGTPVYWYGPTALMKAFIDRFVFFNWPENRAKIRNKFAITVIPFEETNVHTAQGVLNFFEKSLGYLEVNILAQMIVPGVTRKGEVKEKTEYLDDACEIGRRAVLE